eukprot:1585392-Heterocapsa_arctica.AAC.1
MPWVAPDVNTINYMFGVCNDDDKGRLQMAVLVAAPNHVDINTKRHVLKIYGMRAVSGHSSDIDQTNMATRVRPEHYALMSAITHKTRADFIPSILNMGIKPGGPYTGNAGRLTSNFCAFLPTDPRNEVVGRKSSDFNAVIILKPSVITDHAMMMSHNGGIATTETISW